MRISDWSSDVCSSDLTNVAIPLDAGQANGLRSLEPGLWAALNQRRRARSKAGLCHASGRGRRYFCGRLWRIGNTFCESLANGAARRSPLPAAGQPPKAAGIPPVRPRARNRPPRSEEHTAELQSLMRLSSAGFCMKKKKLQTQVPQVQMLDTNNH